MSARWGLFAAGTVLALLAVLWLARASARLLTDGRDQPPGSRDSTPPGKRLAVLRVGSRRALLANLAISQAAVVVAIGALAWYTSVPPSALGLTVSRGGLLSGLVLGGVLYVVGETGVRLLEAGGVGVDDTLRTLLTPERTADWALLFFLVLPVGALGEELLFRAALIGALGAGFPVSPWVLVAASAVAFGLGHGLQGRGGVVVTGALGVGLGAAFVLTDSLAVVSVAHYVVNALEFLVPQLAHVGDR